MIHIYIYLFLIYLFIHIFIYFLLNIFLFLYHVHFQVHLKIKAFPDSSHLIVSHAKMFHLGPACSHYHSTAIKKAVSNLSPSELNLLHPSLVNSPIYSLHLAIRLPLTLITAWYSLSSFHSTCS